MRVAYADTSWLVAVRSDGPASSGCRWRPPGVEAFTTSELSRVELSRILRRREPTRDWSREVRDAVSGVTTVRLSATVLELASRLPVRFLRSLDSLHVASALIVTCDVVLTRDRQMARACRELELPVA